MRRDELEMFVHLKPARACPVRWTELPGTARARRCRCGEPIFAMEALTESAVRMLLRTHGGTAQLFLRPDGAVMAVPCPSRITAAWRSLAPRHLLVLTLVTLALLSSAHTLRVTARALVELTRPPPRNAQGVPRRRLADFAKDVPY